MSETSDTTIQESRVKNVDNKYVFNCLLNKAIDAMICSCAKSKLQTFGPTYEKARFSPMTVQSAGLMCGAAEAERYKYYC